MNIIIKMKKHPIDDLFAKKLAEHRQEPSQKAFEKFQARLTEKQQKPNGGFFLMNRNWGYYAAAAGIIAVLSIGFLSQTNSPKKTTLASASVKNTASEKSQTIKENTNNQEIASIEKGNIDNQTIASAEKSINESFKSDKKVIQQKTFSENTIAQTKLSADKPVKNIIDDSPIEQTDVALNPVFETTINEPIKTIEVATNETLKSDANESIVLILEPEQPANEVIPSIDQDSATLLTEAKSLGEAKDENAKSFIVKLYGEYKHFKYGEKVDLKKLGVKDVLARVDDSGLKEDITDVRDFFQRKASRLQKRD